MSQPTVGISHLGKMIVPPLATTAAAAASMSSTAIVHSYRTVRLPGTTSWRFCNGPGFPDLLVSGGDQEKPRRPPGLEFPAEYRFVELLRPRQVIGVNGKEDDIVRHVRATPVGSVCEKISLPTAAIIAD